MGKQFQSNVEELKAALTEEQFQQTTSYILEYFEIGRHLYKEVNIDLNVTKDSTGSFMVFESERGFLVMIARKSGKGKFIILPMGVCRILACSILDQYNEENQYTPMPNSVYQSLFAMNEFTSSERIDQFLFYISVIVIDSYSLILNRTRVTLSKNVHLFVNGLKHEFYLLDDGTLYDGLVRYDITMHHNRDVIKIIKNYSAGDAKKEDKLEVSIYDIIENSLNEFRTSKK